MKISVFFRPPETVTTERRGEPNQEKENIELSEQDVTGDKTKPCRGFWSAKEKLVPLAKPGGASKVLYLRFMNVAGSIVHLCGRGTNPFTIFLF